MLVVAGQVVQRDLHTAGAGNRAEISACTVERCVGDCLVKQRLAVHGHENAHIGGVHVHNAEAYVIDHVRAEDLAGNGLQNAALVAIALKLDLIGLNDDQNALVCPRHGDRVALVEVEAAPVVGFLWDHLLVLEVEHLAGEFFSGVSGQLIACVAARDGKTPVLEFRSISRVGLPVAFVADKRCYVNLVAEAAELHMDALTAGNRAVIALHTKKLGIRDRLIEQRHIVCRQDDPHIRRIHVIHTERHPIGLAVFDQVCLVLQNRCAAAVADLQFDHVRLDADQQAGILPWNRARALGIEEQAAPFIRLANRCGELLLVVKVQHTVGICFTCVSCLRVAAAFKDHLARDELRRGGAVGGLPVFFVFNQAVDYKLCTDAAEHQTVPAYRRSQHAEVPLSSVQILIVHLVAEYRSPIHGQDKAHIGAVEIVYAEVNAIRFAALKYKVAVQLKRLVDAVADLKFRTGRLSHDKNTLCCLIERQCLCVAHVEVEAAPATAGLLIGKAEGLIGIRLAGVAGRLVGGSCGQSQLASGKGRLSCLIFCMRRPVFRILDQCVDLDHIGRGTGVLVVAEAGVRLLERSHAEIKVIQADRVLCQYGLRVGNGRRDEVNFLLCPLAGLVADLCGFDLSFGLVYQRAEFRLIYRAGERHENRLRPDRLALCAAAVHGRQLAADPPALADGGHGELGAGHVVADLFPVQVEQVVAAFGNVVVRNGRALAVAVRVREGICRRDGLADLRRAGNGNAGSSRLLVAGEALHADLALVDLLETGKPRQNRVDQRIITACVTGKQLPVVALALQDRQIFLDAGDLAVLMIVCFDPITLALFAAARRSVGINQDIVLEGILDVEIRRALSRRSHPRPAFRIPFVVPDLL